MSSNSDKNASDKNAKVTEQQVREFLRKDPDFFTRHPDVLEEINLPHASGDAISLVERQVALLRERNIDMRHRLSKLLDTAKANDKLFDKTRRLLLLLLEAHSLNDLVDSLHFSLNRDFEIPFCQLIFFGDPARIAETQARVVRIHEAREAAPRLISSNRTLCGDLQAAELKFLFDDQVTQVGSAAVVPLIHGTCFGLFAVGHPDPQHYRSTMGTLFLSYIGEVLNRLLPQYLSQ